MASQSIRLSGPFITPPPTPSTATSTTMVVAASDVSCDLTPNLPIRFQRFLGSYSSPDHPAHVSSLSGPGTKVPVCGQLCDDDRVWRVRSAVIVFLSPFGCRHWLLGRPIPPPIYASLTVGLPAADHSSGA